MAEMNEIFSKNFQKFLERRGLTQTDIAEKMEVSNATISYWLSGTKTPRMDKLGRLAKILNTTIHALTEENGFEEYNRQLPSGLIPISDLHRHRIPVLGSIAAGEPVYDPEFPDVVVDGPLDADFALRVHGDSMTPGYLDGDLVFLRSVPDVPHNGSVCAVSVDNEAALKHVFRYADHVLLTSDNQQYEPMAYSFAEHDIRILGVPVGFLRMYK